ncbi:GATA-type zinc finger protein 1 [Tenrec ecaudatus]|uniref:GATA-type zinc finger protein 1 n=1 Tax=Tenrec ecaudatus TaxID=94439 RepID=UPI003F5A3C80
MEAQPSPDFSLLLLLLRELLAPPCLGPERPPTPLSKQEPVPPGCGCRCVRSSPLPQLSAPPRLALGGQVVLGLPRGHRVSYQEFRRDHLGSCKSEVMQSAPAAPLRASALRYIQPPHPTPLSAHPLPRVPQITQGCLRLGWEPWPSPSCSGPRSLLGDMALPLDDWSEGGWTVIPRGEARNRVRRTGGPLRRDSTQSESQGGWKPAQSTAPNLVRARGDPAVPVLRSPSPVRPASVSTLCFLQSGRSCWEPLALGSLARDIQKMATPASQGPPRTPPAPSALPKRRPRKQPKPLRGTEKVDPAFTGVTLKFQIKPDSSLQIIPSYSRPAQEPPPGPAWGPEVMRGGSETLGARRCASCKTQRTPLWRDAEDGTPLCNACGIRYKKYGTRCFTCWLVPRKSVQPKKLCGRCGVSLGSHQGPPQEGHKNPKWKILAPGPRTPQGEERTEASVPGEHETPPQSLLQSLWAAPTLRKCSK